MTRSEQKKSTLPTNVFDRVKARGNNVSLMNLSMARSGQEKGMLPTNLSMTRSDKEEGILLIQGEGESKRKGRG